MTVYANFEPWEGTVTGTATVTLNRRSRKIVITNDHPTQELSYKFNSSETFGTLKGTESLSVYFRASEIFLSGTNVPYRIWVFG